MTTYSDPVLDLRSTNALWASVLVETLVRAGIRQAVISPGSRSTPLTMAFARHEAVTSTPVLDERSAAFFALGLAKAKLEPVVLVCTSGTAGANYFPAVIEAHESGVPLLIMTADRPPEMRECASGQTIDQQKLFGGYVTFHHELAVPELDLGRLRYLRQTVLHAVARTQSPQRGPVHVNLPFRDPLAPLPDGGAARSFAAPINWTEFFAATELTPRPIAVGPVPPLAPDAHGLIVVGPQQPADPANVAESVGAIARRLGWPVLADALSPLRHHADRIPHLVTTYDTVLRNPAVAERLKPDVVVCIGEWPASKVLRGWLEASDAPTWLLNGRGDNRDALHGRTRHTSVSLSVVAASLPENDEAGGYARMWTQYEQKVRTALDTRIRAATELIEPKVAWLLSQHLAPETPLFIANSMPIRDVEYVWPASSRHVRPFCNRGANGIDGTLSTAVGAAQGCGRPAILLTGDLALLHDTNGFLLHSRCATSLTVVVVNNNGGGIFEHLPVAQFDPPFEEYFATPQAVDIPKLCAAYGVPHAAPATWPEFTELISALPVSGLRVVEIRTDRKRDAALRKHWFAELAANLTIPDMGRS